MKISLAWLREFVELDESPEALRVVLDDLGLVVEGVVVVGEGLEDVVVARVDEIRAIKGADRVRLVLVDAGGDPLEIVCGATNFEVGNYVPLAPIGAVLPGGFEIQERVMRGVTSHGMLCSATSSLTSRSRAIDPTRGRWRAWPVTWPRDSGERCGPPPWRVRTRSSRVSPLRRRPSRIPNSVVVSPSRYCAT